MLPHNHYYLYKLITLSVANNISFINITFNCISLGMNNYEQMYELQNEMMDENQALVQALKMSADMDK
jgi:hypothetical protein